MLTLVGYRSLAFIEVFSKLLELVDYLLIYKIKSYQILKNYTDRQTNYLTPYTGVCGFLLSVKFATSLLASLAGG